LGAEDPGLIWDRIGHLHQETGNWQDAESAYRKAVEHDPKKFGYCLGISLCALGRYEEALPLLLAAAQEFQPDAMSWFNVARCYERLGKVPDAEVAYKKAIALDENYADAWFDLGGLYWNHGDQRVASIIWKEAIKRFPEHPNAEIVRDLLKEPLDDSQ
jgi:tetratricopeptide (TPR) repeat protein